MNKLETHEYKPYANPKVNGQSCVRCGRPKDHPIHKTK